MNFCGLGASNNFLKFYVPVVGKNELLQEGSFDLEVFNQPVSIERIGNFFFIKEYFINIIKLDDFKKEFSLIKIDVQGFEYEVLKGASRILESQNPVVIIEKDEMNDYRIRTLMGNFGYQAKEGIGNIIFLTDTYFKIFCKISLSKH